MIFSLNLKSPRHLLFVFFLQMNSLFWKQCSNLFATIPSVQVLYLPFRKVRRLRNLFSAWITHLEPLLCLEWVILNKARAARTRDTWSIVRIGVSDQLFCLQQAIAIVRRRVPSMCTVAEPLASDTSRGVLLTTGGIFSQLLNSSFLVKCIKKRAIWGSCVC